MSFAQIEFFLMRLGAVAGITTLAIALAAIFSSLLKPPGREEPGARIALRLPVLLFETILFIAFSVLLWHPLPLRLATWTQALAVLAGSFFLFGGLSLYLWGLSTLRGVFAPSSGFGVRLHVSHVLVTSGPYAHVRHPMYLAVIGAALGSLLLYRTWTTLFFAIAMLGVVFRARREEKVLAQEFGPKWEAYASEVPGWLPHLARRRRGGA